MKTREWWAERIKDLFDRKIVSLQMTAEMIRGGSNNLNLMEESMSDDQWMMRLVDPPAGYCLRCPGCESWATLVENAKWHKQQSGHGVPYVDKIPRDNLDRMEDACSQPKKPSA